MNRKTLRLVQLSTLAAITLILGLTPLGLIPIPFLGFEITILQIPTIVAAVMLGPVSGLIMGLVFGGVSFLKAPTAIGLGQAIYAYNIFYAAVVCIVPRALMGLLCGYLSTLLKKLKVNNIVTYSISGLLGSLMNTVFFLSLVYLLCNKFLSEAFSDFLSTAGQTLGVYFIFGIGMVNGVAEAVISVILVAAICKVLERYTVTD